jgi:hypothetical protein
MISPSFSWMRGDHPTPEIRQKEAILFGSFSQRIDVITIYERVLLKTLLLDCNCRFLTIKYQHQDMIPAISINTGLSLLFQTLLLLTVTMLDGGASAAGTIVSSMII